MCLVWIQARDIHHVATRTWAFTKYYRISPNANSETLHVTSFHAIQYGSRHLQTQACSSISNHFFKHSAPAPLQILHLPEKNSKQTCTTHISTFRKTQLPFLHLHTFWISVNTDKQRVKQYPPAWSKNEKNKNKIISVVCGWVGEIRNQTDICWLILITAWYCISISALGYLDPSLGTPYWCHKHLSLTHLEFPLEVFVHQWGFAVVTCCFSTAEWAVCGRWLERKAVL